MITLSNEFGGATTTGGTPAEPIDLSGIAQNTLLSVEDNHLVSSGVGVRHGEASMTSLVLSGKMRMSSLGSMPLSLDPLTGKLYIPTITEVTSEGSGQPQRLALGGQDWVTIQGTYADTLGTLSGSFDVVTSGDHMTTWYYFYADANAEWKNVRFRITVQGDDGNIVTCQYPYVNSMDAADGLDLVADENGYIGFDLRDNPTLIQGGRTITIDWEMDSGVIYGDGATGNPYMAIYKQDYSFDPVHTDEFTNERIEEIEDKVDAMSGAIVIQGNWDASTNTPDISDTTDVPIGYAWRVQTAGDTTLGTENDWNADDLAVWTATGWANFDNSQVEVINDLTTGSSGKALSAEQGKVLKEMFDELTSDQVSMVDETTTTSHYLSVDGGALYMVEV